LVAGLGDLHYSVKVAELDFPSFAEVAEIESLHLDGLVGLPKAAEHSRFEPVELY
jgi:hypothetical protein